MVMDVSNGQMVENMMVNGGMESSTELGCIQVLHNQVNDEENGKMANA